MAASAEALIAEYAVAPTPPSPSAIFILTTVIYQLILIQPRPKLHTSPYIIILALPHADGLSLGPIKQLDSVESCNYHQTQPSIRWTYSIHKIDYGFIDTMDASIRASKSRAMTTVGEVNEKLQTFYYSEAGDS
ncbi:hypothetical protein Tco_0890772 [Tanacetum coccineum]|uniref:Uncharacterized protein n=1 Tax=Tanacetum coccineum TaxID=301880 RepID=A0ABQ5C118_9ASTR